MTASFMQCEITHLLFNCMPACLLDWLTDRLTDWLTACLTAWLLDCLTGLLTDWLTNWLVHSRWHPQCHSYSVVDSSLSWNWILTTFNCYLNSNITSLVPPKIVLAAVEIVPGSRVPCSATGTPPIYIASIRNFTVLMNTTNTASSKLYQEGNYTCVATSNYGTDVKHFVIKGEKILYFETNPMHTEWRLVSGGGLLLVATDEGRGTHPLWQNLTPRIFMFITFLIMFS